MRKFEPVAKELQKNEEVILPLRGTRTSAGYDFYTPIDLVIEPQQKVFFWTDVKAIMPEKEVLLLDVRSSSGTQLDLMLANTIPVIDSDYAQAKNGGNIGIMLRNLKPSMQLEGVDLIQTLVHAKDKNGELTGEIIETVRPLPIIKDLTKENTVFIPKGDRVAQGIFINFNESENCNTEKERVGGFGSTNNN